MRPIDADKLLEKCTCDEYGCDRLMGCHLCKHHVVTEEEIANEPTVELEPNDCVLTEFGKCSYKETGCSDCKIKSNLRYMCHGSAWKELQALREFKERYEKKGKWEYTGMGVYQCTNCKAEYEIGIVDHCSINNPEFKFCPNCGAKMEGKL